LGRTIAYERIISQLIGAGTDEVKMTWRITLVYRYALWHHREIDFNGGIL
jgi:hypothetical protein